MVHLWFSVTMEYYFLCCWLVTFATSQIFWVYLHGGSINHLSWDFPTVVHRSTVDKAVVRVRLVNKGWCMDGPKSPGPKLTGPLVIAHSWSLR